MHVIHYFVPITFNNMTYSVDGIVMDFIIRDPAIREKLAFFLENLPITHHADVVSWQSFKPGTFRSQNSVKLDNGASFWVGCALNGVSTHWAHHRVEFNPNRVADSEVFRTVLRFIVENTREVYRSVRRFDLAVDIPIERGNCFLVKDRRLYIERRHGQELTQYLGAKSSTVGRVKLYNKQVESGLDYPLTRLELTIDPATPYDKVNFPEVYFLDTLDLCTDEIKATDTEKFIVNALLQGFGSLNDLGRKTRAKVKALLQEHVHSAEVPYEIYEAILSQVCQYLHGVPDVINDSVS